MKQALLHLSLIASLAVAPVLAQGPGGRGGRGGSQAMRADFEAAIKNGNLTAEEKQKYDAAMKTLDEARAKREAGETPDRDAMRAAMKNLSEVAKSPNLKAEDREKLSRYAAGPGGPRGGKRGGAAPQQQN